jgi:hypothetical protein
MYNNQKTRNEGQAIFWSLYIVAVLHSLSSDHCAYCLSFVLCLLIIVHIVCPSFFVFWSLYILSVLRSLSSDHCTTICTMIRRQRTKDKQYVQWLEDKERRTDNMYNDQKIRNEGQTICTMIRRQGTKERQYVQWSEDKERRTDNMYNDQKTKNEGQTICTYCLSFVPCLLIIVHIVCPSFFVFWSLYILSVLRS